MSIYSIFDTTLIKQRYNYYAENTGVFLNSEERTPTFWGSPIDYTQPYACRVLDERN